MNGKRIQFNGRSAISLLVAVLILVIAITPALAKEDEGGSLQPARGQTVVLDDEGMGFLSLKVTRPAAVTASTSVTVRVDDEGMGFISLKGARQIERPATHPALAKMDDEEMRFLSLKVARHTAVASGAPALASAQ